MDKLFPAGTELSTAALRGVVRTILATRPGEPPPTGRELRALVALLDVNNNGQLGREELEQNIKACR